MSLVNKLPSTEPWTIQKCIIESLRAKNDPAKLVHFLEDAMAKDHSIRFDSKETYCSFLSLIKSKLPRNQELYVTALRLFRRRLGLPEAAFDAEVTLTGKNGAQIVVSKHLLTSFNDYFTAGLSPGFKEGPQNKIESQLGREALEAYRGYLYTDDFETPSYEVLCELDQFAEVTMDDSLKALVGKKTLEHFCDEKNEAHIDPGLLAGYSNEFARAYLNKKGIKYTEDPSGKLKLPLSAFINLFQNKDSKLCQILALGIYGLTLDCSVTGLRIIPTRYRRAITAIYPQERAAPYTREECIAFKKFQSDYFPNAQVVVLLPQNAMEVSNCLLHLLVGDAWRRLKNYAEAIGAYQRALEIDKDNAEACAQLGVCLQTNTISKNDQAETFARRALGLNEKNATAHYVLGSRLLKQGKMDEAEKELQRSLYLDEKNSTARQLLGEAYGHRKEYAKAENELRRAIESYGGSSQVHFSLGRSLRAQYKLAEAEKEYRRSLELQENSPTVHDSLGEVLFCRHRYGEAEIELRRSLQLFEGNYEAHSMLGCCLLKFNRLDVAEIELRRALQLNENHPYAHSRLGGVLLRQNKPVESEKELRRALELGEQNSYTHFWLGELLLSQNKLDEAETHARHALELFEKDHPLKTPHHIPDINAAKQLLATILDKKHSSN